MINLKTFYKFEIRPCREVPTLSQWNAETARVYGRSPRRPVERCTIAEVEFWTVYGITHPHDEAKALADCPTEEIARRIALSLEASRYYGS